MKSDELGRRINPILHEIYLGRVKAFLIEAKDGSLILVDTGMPKSEMKIIKYVNSIGKSVKDIKYILLTHAHIDHFGSAAAIKKLSDAHVAINGKGIKYIDGTAGVLLPNPASLKGFGNKLMFSLFRLSLTLSKPKFLKPDMALKEGVFPEQMKINAKILETPGHTEDSISIWLPDIKTVIVGDLLFGAPDRLANPVFFDDYVGLLESKKKVEALDPDLICVAHGKNHNVSDMK